MTVINYKFVLFLLILIVSISCKPDDDPDNTSQEIVNSFIVGERSIPLEYALIRHTGCEDVDGTTTCIQKLTFLSNDFNLTAPNNLGEVDFTGSIGDGIGLIFYSSEEQGIAGEFTFSSSINAGLNTFSGGYGIGYDLGQETGEQANISNGTLNVLENSDGSYIITIENGSTDNNDDFSLNFEGKLFTYEFDGELFQ